MRISQKNCPVTENKTPLSVAVMDPDGVERTEYCRKISAEGLVGRQPSVSNFSICDCDAASRDLLLLAPSESHDAVSLLSRRLLRAPDEL